MKKPFQLSSFAEKLGLNVAAVLAAMIGFYLAALSLLRTTVVDRIDAGEGMQTVVYQIAERVESVIYYHDNFYLNLIVLAACLMICFMLAQRKKPIRLRWLCLFLFLWTFALGTIWVLSSQCKPSEDSAMVVDAAKRFAEGNYDWLNNERYYHNYSFQLGYVFFNELIIRGIQLITPMKTMMPLEILNAGFLAGINTLLLMIGAELFRDSRVNLVTAVLLAVSTAPIISCAFVYGIFPGMMFALAAVYCEIRWLKESRLHFAVISAFSIALAMMIKSNYLIWLIAMLLIGLIKMIGRKKYLADLAYFAAASALALCIQSAVISHYEKICGETLRDTVPYISWIAMGLNESSLAPGWYDYSYTLTNFENAGMDPEEAAECSKEQVKERLEYFRDHPQYTNDFFTLKVESQWNETSYESIWNNIVRYQYKEKGAIAKWVCETHTDAIRQVMDYFAQLVFAGFFLGCVFIRRRGEFLMTPLPVIVLGGFFYQLISEGKSQYIMPYFILMTAFAAFGIVSLRDVIAARVPADSRFGRLLNVQPSAETAPAAAVTEQAGAAASPAGQKPSNHKKKKEKHHG